MRVLHLKPLLLSFAFCITGAFQIVVGGGLIWMHLRYSTIVNNAFWWPAVILLCLGPAVFVLCWFGWNAAARKNRFYLGLFSAGLVILLCVQFWICGWAVSMRESLPHTAEFSVSDSFHGYVRDQSDRDHLWNKLQTEAKCCGIYGVVDYRRVSVGNTQPAIPWACCSRSEDPHEPFCKNVFQRGCLQALSDDTRQSLLICALTALGCAILQSIGLFCAVQLVILLGRTTSFDIERDNSSSAPPQERPKELLPLASTPTKKKAPPLPVPIPGIPPSSIGEKMYKERLHHDNNGN